MKHSRKIDGIRVNVYTYSDLALFDTSDGEADEKAHQIARILPFFQRYFGPYRYETLQVVESPLSNVGMAADGLILLGDATFIYDRSWIAWGLFATGRRDHGSRTRSPTSGGESASVVTSIRRTGCPKAWPRP